MKFPLCGGASKAYVNEMVTPTNPFATLTSGSVTHSNTSFAQPLAAAAAVRMKKLLKALDGNATDRAKKASNKNLKLVQSINLEECQVLDSSQIILGAVCASRSGTQGEGARARAWAC